jgi:hypothetical protein
MNPEILALLVPIVALCIPIVAIMSSHQRKLAEMKMRMTQQADANTLAELRALKQQMTELRDTTTRYDLSFDAALQRLESRMANIEQRVTGLERERQSAQAGSGQL